jgi:phospholipase/carboxylesterase
VTDLPLAVEGPLTFRYLMPEHPETIQRILLMLHGWTGDENIMWIFARELLPDTAILSPRGFVDADPSGYGWIKASQKFQTPVKEYAEAARQVLLHLDRWLQRMKIPLLPVDVMGFSQGAAMAGVLVSEYPERIGKTAMLAGFLPAGTGQQINGKNLAGKEIFIAHGTRDDVVPFSMAEESVRVLSLAGAKVTFCPSDTTHKLSLGCTKEMQEFFQSI